MERLSFGNRMSSLIRVFRCNTYIWLHIQKKSYKKNDGNLREKEIGRDITLYVYMIIRVDIYLRQTHAHSEPLKVYIYTHGDNH